MALRSEGGLHWGPPPLPALQGPLLAVDRAPMHGAIGATGEQRKSPRPAAAAAASGGRIRKTVSLMFQIIYLNISFYFSSWRFRPRRSYPSFPSEKEFERQRGRIEKTVIFSRQACVWEMVVIGDCGKKEKEEKNIRTMAIPGSSSVLVLNGMHHTTTTKWLGYGACYFFFLFDILPCGPCFVQGWESVWSRKSVVTCSMNRFSFFKKWEENSVHDMKKGKNAADAIYIQKKKTYTALQYSRNFSSSMGFYLTAWFFYAKREWAGTRKKGKEAPRRKKHHFWLFSLKSMIHAFTISVEKKQRKFFFFLFSCVW